MPPWLAIMMALLTLLFVGAWGFLFYALFSYFEADSAMREERHQLRLARIRAGLPTTHI